MLASKAISRGDIAKLTAQIREKTIPRWTATVARRALAEVQGGKRVRYRQFVDGREGAPLDSVRVGGQIRFLFQRLGPVLEWIYEELVPRSPVGPERGEPHYRDVHWVFVDEKRTWPGAVTEIQVNEKVVFVNTRPYARRLEHGWSTQAPDGVYELVGLEATRRFPQALTEFGYLRPEEVPEAIPWRTRPYYAYPSLTVRARQ